MTPPPPEHRAADASDRDAELAAALAEGAGQLLLAVRDQLTGEGATIAELRDEGDRRAHEWIVGHLAEARPRDAVLSEEATEDGERESDRLHTERVWIVDPLDGTREFGEGRADWAVHIALTVAGTPVAAAVALPAQGITLHSARPPVVPPPPARLRVVVSRSRPPAEALRIAETLDAEVLEMGSAGAKAMSVVLGESDIYPHSGGQYEWDSCAPVGVATAAGLHCCRLDGSPLEYNRADPYLPDLLVCRREHAAAVIEAAAG